MRFDEVVLAIMQAVDGQRTISAPYHLIKGKKSGQTIQDIGYFGLHPFFAIAPKLEKSEYMAAIDRLQRDGMLIPDPAALVRLSAAARAYALPPCFLDGWKYRGSERLFFARLALTVQTLSYFAQNYRRFDPVVTDEGLQAWVKKYLKRIRFTEPAVQRAFKQEMETSLELSKAQEWQKDLLLERLSGYGVGGMTWDQLAMLHGILPIDAKIAMAEALHAWMDAIDKHNTEVPLLHDLLEGLVQPSRLTESAKRTLNLFERGFSLAQIAELRQLKTSTIEDHFVEMAMNDPAFRIAPFMDIELFRSIQTISKEMKTMRLRDIKEQLPEASYFQIRLALASGGDGK